MPPQDAASPDQPFLTLRDPDALPAALSRPVIAIGNFDGLHLGHKRVLRQTLDLARRLGRPAILLTFEPHPQAFFRPGIPFFRLTPGAARAELLGRLGLNGMVEISFDAALAATTAGDFIEAILCQRLGASGIVTGQDFHFGQGREGSPEFLMAAGARHGFVVEVVAPLEQEGRQISSTAIRAALARGDAERANAALGHDWFVRGKVLHGQKLGRTLGFPTANLRLPEECGLAHGIYAARACIDGKWRDGVASFGRRPTFDNGAPLLEMFVFDFSGDLYGKTIDIAFAPWIRGEAKFASADALASQMKQDCADARADRKSVV